MPRGGRDDRVRVGDLSGGGLHDRERDQIGGPRHVIGEPREGSGPHADPAPGVDEGQHDRRELSLGDQHLRSVGQRCGNERCGN
jgi:hypothetical protein